ncbi:MAG: amidohydrolase, partial [Acidimicrobiia bacterium]
MHSSAGLVEALAIDARGIIVATGTTADIEKLAGASSRRIDLQGRAVLPGFHDQHVHPLFAGLRQRQCAIPQGASIGALRKGLADCAARTPKGHWIIGGQWDASALGVVPHRSLLDSAAPDHPVLIDDTSGHSSWANSRALQLANLTARTRNPSGGIIERDRKGNPTGVLRESAIELVRRDIPPPTDAEVREALSWALGEMLSHGITSYTEASLGFPAGPQKELDAYVALADAGALKQRVRLCMTWVPRLDSGAAVAEEVIATRNLYARERVSPDCVKIFLDGVPTDSHTAAMLEPYAGTIPGRTDDASRFGLVRVPKPMLDQAVARFDRMGLAVKFHAAGDAA